MQRQGPDPSCNLAKEPTTIVWLAELAQHPKFFDESPTLVNHIQCR